MDWLWDLISKNFWLVLILLGVVGQVFTPNPKKRQQARERQRAKRLRREAELSGQRAPMEQSEPQEPPKERPRAQPEDIAERIRELFEGKRGPVSEVEDFPEQAPVLEMPSPVAAPQSRSTSRSTSRSGSRSDRLSGSGGARSEAEVSHAATRGRYFDPHSIGGSTAGSSVALGAALGRGKVVEMAEPEGPDRSWAIKADVDRRVSLDPRDAVRALLILGPPRALASYEEDPLLSRYHSMI